MQPTVRDLLNLVKKDYVIYKKRSLRSLCCHISHLESFFPPEGPTAENVKLGNIQEYVMFRKQEGASNGTINRELTTLKRGFNLGLECEMINRAPKIRKLYEDNVRKGFVELDEFEVVKKTLPSHYARIYEFAYCYGWRKTEILTLPRNAFSLESRELTLAVEHSKNKEPRIIVVFGDGLRVVQEAAAYSDERQSVWLFCEKDGTRIATSTFDLKFKIAVATAGYPNRLFHDLRRSATRNLDRAGVPRKVAMEFTGHKTESQHQRYNISSRDDLRIGAEKLDKYLQNLSVVKTQNQNGVAQVEQPNMLSERANLETKDFRGVIRLFKSILGVKKEEKDV